MLEEIASQEACVLAVYYVLVLCGGLTLIYSSHLLVETLNSGVVVYVVSLLLHVVSGVSRYLYVMSLYVELVWILGPSCVVVVLIARTILMQCGDEELCGVGYILSFTSVGVSCTRYLSKQQADVLQYSVGTRYYGY
mgnify:CR=1 FL=1